MHTSRKSSRKARQHRKNFLETIQLKLFWEIWLKFSVNMSCSRLTAIPRKAIKIIGICSALDDLKIIRKPALS